MNKIKLKDIRTLVEEEINLKLKVNNRQRRYVIGRFIYGKLSKKYTSETLMSIGRGINRDHSSINYYLKTFDSFYSFDHSFRRIYNKLESQIEALIEIRKPKNITIKPSVIHPYRLRNAPQSLRKVLIKRR